jgi:hypothetical protein
LWKRKYPKSRGIPKQILMQGKPPLFMIPMMDNYSMAYKAKQIEMGMRPLDHFPPYNPPLKFDLISSGYQQSRDLAGPYPFPDCGPLPYQKTEWFTLEYDTEKPSWAAETTVTTQNNRNWGNLTAWFYFITIIDIAEEGDLALHINSRAMMEGGWYDGNFGSPGIIYYWLNQTHHVIVERQAEDSVDIVLSRDPWGERTYEQGFFDSSEYEDDPTVYRVGYINQKGPNAEYVDNPPLIFTSVANDGEPLYVDGRGGITTIAGGQSKFGTGGPITLFKGPCRIKISELVCYSHFVLSSNGRRGVMEIGALHGSLDPLQWKLYKVTQLLAPRFSKFIR